MIRSTNRTGKALTKELYTEAMRALRYRKILGIEYMLPKFGWVVIRAYGKDILKNPEADDSECADAVIMKWRDNNFYGRG